MNRIFKKNIKPRHLAAVFEAQAITYNLQLGLQVKKLGSLFPDYFLGSVAQ